MIFSISGIDAVKLSISFFTWISVLFRIPVGPYAFESIPAAEGVSPDRFSIHYFIIVVKQMDLTNSAPTYILFFLDFSPA